MLSQLCLENFQTGVGLNHIGTLEGGLTTPSVNTRILTTVKFGVVLISLIVLIILTGSW